MGRHGGEGPIWDRPLGEQMAALRHDMAPFPILVEEVLAEQKAIERRVRVLERVTADLHRWADESHVADLSVEERTAYVDLVRWWRRRNERIEEEQQKNADFRKRLTTIATLIGAAYTLVLIAVAVLALRR